MAVVDSGSGATILVQELFNKLASSNTKMLHIGGYPIMAVVDSGSGATILVQELFNKLASSKTKMLHIGGYPIMAVVDWLRSHDIGSGII
jgi:CRISPR/Cas system-associated endonuclease Cas3-HD